MAQSLKPPAERISLKFASPTTSEPVQNYGFTFADVEPIAEEEEETEEVKFEEIVKVRDRTGKMVDMPVYDNNGKKIYRPTYNEAGVETHDDRGIMTYDEWLKQKNEGDVDWWRVAKDATSHLIGGFGKIPGKIEEEGLLEASANIPESFLSAMEGLRMIGGGAGRLLAKPFRSEEEENKAEYEAYKDFGNQMFRQLEMRKSRMGDVARMFGAKELAEVYDDGIDPEVADSLSLIFDPTYLVGGGLLKVGAAATRQAPKITNKYAKKVIQAAGKAAETKLAKEALSVLSNPVTKTVSGTGKVGELVGRGLQKGAAAGEKALSKAPAIGVVGGGAIGYATAPEGRKLEGTLGGIVGGGALGGAVKYSGKLGEKLEKTSQRIGGAAQAARINSVRTSGLGTVAKTRPMREDVAKQFVTYDNRVANRILQEAGKLADTAVVGAGMGAGLGSLMPTDPNNPGWAAGLGIGTFAAPAGMYSGKALNQLARVEIGRGGVPSAEVRLRIKETPDHQLGSEAVVKRFVAGLPEEQRVRFVDADRGLSVHDLATQAEAVNWAMGAKRYAGKDVDLFVGNAQEVVAKTGNPFHEKQAGFHDPVTNTIYINTDAEVSTMTLLHEVFHPTETWSSRQKKLDTETEETVEVDPLQDLQTDLVQTIVGTYAPDGSQMRAGLYSADEIASFIDQYNSKLYPDLTKDIARLQSEIDAETAKPTSDEAALRLMNRDIEELKSRQEYHESELAAFETLPESEKRNYIAREILSEQFAMFGESARHGIIRKARNIAFKKDYFKDKFLGMEIDKLKFNTLGRLRKTLERVGVKFDLAGNPRGDMTATSILFKDLDGRQMAMEPGVEHLIAQYITEKDKLVNRVSETDEIGGSEVTFTAIDASKKNKDGTPKVPAAVIERWAQSGWVKTDKDGDVVNSTGGKWQPGQRPAFTTTRERNRMDKDRVAALVAALDPVTKKLGEDEEPTGVVTVRDTADGGKNFSGGYFDEAQMQAIMNTDDDVVRPAFKQHIKMMNDAVKNREGQPFLADYWKAISGNGYTSKARMKVHLFTPIGMQISSAGNFNATVFNIGYLENKINRWLGQSGKKKFWSDWADADGRVDVDSFRRDMMELLGTHFIDDPSKKFPEGIKKEKLYSFIGIKPFEPGRQDWNRSAKDRKQIHSLRIDRMQELTPGMGDNFPINYGKSRARYMPGQPQSSVRPPVDDLGFFSRVAEVAASDKIPNRGSGDQMLATIKKQPGVKEEELKWLGLEDYLRGKKQVTKQELTDFIRENDIQLEETILSGDSYDSYDPDKKTSPARYGEYQLPGAEDGSYKEMLLRLPSNNLDEAIYRNMDLFFDLKNPKEVQTQLKFFTTGRKAGDDILFEASPERIFNRLKQIRGNFDEVTGKSEYRSSHWEEPNILAHVRFNDRTGPNGEKILFVEELQSDWHKEGREYGYGEEVPDAPFKSSWHELATKRMLRYAAENGYDKLAFIDGQSTADRYTLSNQADFLAYRKTSDGSYRIEIGKDGDQVASKTVPESRLASFVGKDIAEKMKKSEGQQADPDANSDWPFLSREEKDAWADFDEKPKTKFLRGLDLKIGGDWAFNLYDRMIPQFLKKYGKKFGAKVEDVEISLSDPEEAALTGIGADEVEATNFKAIDITPQMRGEDGVMGGQVRFMPGVEKFDTVEPSIISESVKIKPGALDGVRFMPGTAPRIPLSQVADSDPFIMLSDRMADMVYEVPGSGVRIPIHGGPGFSYRDGKAVWASTRNAAKKIGNYVNNSGKNRALIMIQRDDNHAKNPSMGRIFVEELKAREKNITKTDMNKMLRAASKRAGLKKSVKNLNELESLYTFWDWDTRGNFFGQFGLVNKPHSPIGDPRKRGFFDYHQIIKDTTDPALADLPTGSIVGAIEFDGGKVYEASELGTVPHSSYDTMLKGRGLGLFENPPHISDILDVPENQRSVFTLSRRFTSPNRLKEAAKLEVDKIIKIPAKKKVQRKDRAMEILKQFSKNKNANRNTKKAQ